MIKFISAAFICLFFCCTASAQWTDADRLEDCNAGKTAALADIVKGKMKYYSIGMKAPMIGYLVDHFRREHLGLRVELIGCMVEDNMFCYNNAVDSFFRVALHTDIDAEIKRKVDSFKTSVPRKSLPRLYNSMGIDYFGDKDVSEAPAELRQAFLRRTYGVE